jgi:toxin HigB-1
MIDSFKHKGTEDIFNGKDTKESRSTCPIAIRNVAIRKLDQINAATLLDDLRVPPKNRLEVLMGDRKGQHSIRINDRYRICFVWTSSGAEQVEIVDYH